MFGFVHWVFSLYCLLWSSFFSGFCFFQISLFYCFSCCFILVNSYSVLTNEIVFYSLLSSFQLFLFFFSFFFQHYPSAFTLFLSLISFAFPFSSLLSFFLSFFLLLCFFTLLLPFLTSNLLSFLRFSFSCFSLIFFLSFFLFFFFLLVPSLSVDICSALCVPVLKRMKQSIYSNHFSNYDWLTRNLWITWQQPHCDRWWLILFRVTTKIRKNTRL